MIKYSKKEITLTSFANMIHTNLEDGHYLDLQSKLFGELTFNGVKIGEGEAVIVEGKFGIKIRSIGSEEDRLNQISLGKK